jgi:hypothetical protein
MGKNMVMEKKKKREINKGELPLLAIHWELGNIPSTGGDVYYKFGAK